MGDVRPMCAKPKALPVVIAEPAVMVKRSSAPEIHQGKVIPRSPLMIFDGVEWVLHEPVALSARDRR
jgi:hypothetical protein